MPSGQIHLSNTITMSAVLAVGAFFIDPNLLSIPDRALIVSGCALGCIVGPDQDVDNGYVGLAILRKIPLIGPLVSGLWRFYWLPYSKIIRHRSIASHAPGISTLIRLVLCFAPIIGLGLALNWFQVAPVRELCMIFLGLLCSDLQHWAADKASKEI